MPVDTLGQPINSERFGLSVPDLHIPPTSRACNQREMNHADRRSGQGPQTTKEKEMISKSREIFDPAAQALQPEFPLHLSLLGYCIYCAADWGSA